MGNRSEAFDEELAEFFAKRLDLFMEQGGISDNELAKRLNIHPQSVKRYRSEAKDIGQVRDQIVELLGREPADFTPAISNPKRQQPLGPWVPLGRTLPATATKEQLRLYRTRMRLASDQEWEAVLAETATRGAEQAVEHDRDRKAREARSKVKGKKGR